MNNILYITNIDNNNNSIYTTSWSKVPLFTLLIEKVTYKQVLLKNNLLCITHINLYFYYNLNRRDNNENIK